MKKFLLPLVAATALTISTNAQSLPQLKENENQKTEKKVNQHKQELIKNLENEGIVTNVRFLDLDFIIVVTLEQGKESGFKEERVFNIKNVNLIPSNQKTKDNLNKTYISEKETKKLLDEMGNHIKENINSANNPEKKITTRGENISKLRSYTNDAGHEILSEYELKNEIENLKQIIEDLSNENNNIEDKNKYNLYTIALAVLIIISSKYKRHKKEKLLNEIFSNNLNIDFIKKVNSDPESNNITTRSLVFIKKEADEIVKLLNEFIKQLDEIDCIKREKLKIDNNSFYGTMDNFIEIINSEDLAKKNHDKLNKIKDLHNKLNKIHDLKDAINEKFEKRGIKGYHFENFYKNFILKKINNTQYMDNENLIRDKLYYVFSELHRLYRYLQN